MRIVHVLPGLVKGGGERVVVDLANQQVLAGHCVTVIAGVGADPALLQNRLSLDVAVKLLRPQGSPLGSAYAVVPVWLWKNRRWLSSQDILHCHLSFGLAFGGIAGSIRWLTRWPRPAIVETYHAVGMPIPRHHRWLHGKLAARRDGLVLMARDPWWEQFIASHPDLLLRVIENGVDVGPDLDSIAGAKEDYRRQLGIPGSCRELVGTVGQLRFDREPWELIPVFRRIADAMGPTTHFLIAGEGPARLRVDAAVKQFGLDGRVHLPGQVELACLPASIMNSYLTLAVGPTVGLAAIEASFAGAPVIARQMDKHYRRSESDWVWSDSDGARIADKAILLLRSAGQLASLARTQNDVVEARFGAAAMAQAYDQLYGDALATRPLIG